MKNWKAWIGLFVVLFYILTVSGCASLRPPEGRNPYEEEISR